MAIASGAKVRAMWPMLGRKLTAADLDEVAGLFIHAIDAVAELLDAAALARADSLRTAVVQRLASGALAKGSRAV